MFFIATIFMRLKLGQSALWLILLCSCACSSLFTNASKKEPPAENSLSAQDSGSRAMLGWQQAKIKKRPRLPQITYRDAPEVRRYLYVFTSSQRTFVSEALPRRAKYLPTIDRIMIEQRVPKDLSNVAFIESRFQPSVDGQGTSGMWQLSRDTARLMGLRVNDQYDERKDVQKSTVAAVKYLNMLYDRYQDWLLAVAAYNCGSTRIDQILSTTKERDLFELSRQGRLTKDVSDFVAKFVALSLITRNLDVYGFHDSSANPKA